MSGFLKNPAEAARAGSPCGRDACVLLQQSNGSLPGRVSGGHTPTVLAILQQNALKANGKFNRLVFQIIEHNRISRASTYKG